METRYYSEKGRPGGEHKLALHASRKVYERITGHLDRKERLAEDLAKEATHRKYLKDAIKAMTSQWENSVENLRKNKEIARQQRQAQKADDRVERYYKVLKWQAEEREKYNKEVKQKIFQMRGSQRDINSSVLFSECLYANKKHIELRNREVEEADKDSKQFEQRLMREDEKFKKDEEVKARNKRVAAKKNLEFIKKEILERKKTEEEEKNINLETEKLDIVKEREEMIIIRRNEEEDLLRAKRRSLKILKDSREEAERIRQHAAKSNAELETVCNIFRDAKTEINCAREEMRKRDIQKRLDLQKVAFQNLEEILNKKKCDEEPRITKALAEIDEAEARKRKAREEYEDKLVKERKENYENALEEKKDMIEIEKERSKWETLNRLKLMEICKTEEEQRDAIKSNKIIEYKKILEEQLKENREYRAEKRATEDAFKWNDYPEKDKMFLEYGSEMLAKQKAAGKPTYPIELAIMEYRKKHNLIPSESRNSCTKNEDKEAKIGMKLPIITRRICPTKNDSTGIQNCFCAT